jgi:hypothetical protein
MINLPKRILNLILVGVLLLTLSGCFGIGGTTMEKTRVDVHTGINAQTVGFDLTPAAILQQIIPNNASQSEKNSSPTYGEMAVQHLNGTLTILQGATTIGAYMVTASVNDNTWNVELFQTFALDPGSYTFDLVLTQGDLQYGGVASFTVVADQSNSIPLVIFPVIGDTLTETQIISELGSFKFSYSEITQLTNFDPNLGIIVDGGSEQLFEINQTTGMTESYLNLSVGEHNIELKLYDGQQQKGRSDPAQETQNIVAGQNLSMNLVPIYGTAIFTMSVSGTDASFDIRIPKEIVENQAGGLANLSVPYIINGPGTDNSQVEGEITQISYDSSNDDYLGHFEISGQLYPSIIYIYLSFINEAEDELIGTCNIQSALNSAERTVFCEIPVTNSLISTGNLLGTVGFTVCEPDASGDCGTPVGGANVYSLDPVNGDELLGITSLGVVASTGFLKSDLKAGNYTFRAVHSDGRFGESSLTLASLGVENVDLILDASAPTNPSIVINGGEQYTYSQYATLTLAANDQQGISAYYVSDSSTAPGDNDWITVAPAVTFQMSTAFQLSAGTGLKTVYVWYKNLGGHRSEVVQGTITVQDDASLYYGNFAFTTSAFDSPFDGSDSRCLSLGTNYRIADWQELKTIITQNAAVDSDDYITSGSLAPSEGTAVPWGYIGGNSPTGAFVSYNGNEDNGGDYFAISVPSNNSRDTYFGWNPHSESVSDNGSIQLYNINSGETATALCYLDSGAHPLLNGDFSDGMTHWDHTLGNAQVNSEALALLTYDPSGDSRIEQDKIAVKPSTAYRIAFKAKTSLESLVLTIGISGGQVSGTSYDELPANWVVNTNSIEMAGPSSDSGDIFYFDITLDLTTGASDQELNLYFQIENDGSIGSGQSATIDSITLTEL